MYFSAVINNWAGATKHSAFNLTLVTGLVILALLFLCFPYFFQYIQQRQGHTINDVVLNTITTANVSVPLFIIIWCMGAYMGIKAIEEPRQMLLFLWAFIFLSIFRIACIWLVALNPPHGLVPLSDPITNRFYGKKFITKDLFYSGHTATIFLIFLCLETKPQKIAALIATVAVAVLVLVQHVHYTIDVIAAPLFAGLCYLIGKKITGSINLVLLMGGYK